MSTNQNNNKNNNKEPSFDENRAYEELRMIFVIAIETQDFSTLEARISAWENKYPLAEFTDPEIIRKIKAILNKDFLSKLIGDYLASKILHEQEKQKEAYDNLKAIIDTAKKSKDYKIAQKEVRKWKDNLHSNGFSLCDFNRLYRARICTLLLLPSKELKNQEQATDELKKIKENASSMNSKDYFNAISNWQNTYAISDFPEKLQKDLNKITTEVFDSISQKRTSENAISEIEEILSSKKAKLPVDAIASVLSKYDYHHFDADTTEHIKKLNMEALSIQEDLLKNGLPDIDLSVLPYISPVESDALSSLKDILEKTPHNMDTILNWIYVNRKISYSEFARESIVKQFASVGYKIPIQASYSIPEINPNINYSEISKIDDLRQGVILNYLGLLSQGNKLTIEQKTSLLEAHTVSEQESIVEEAAKPTMFLEVFDTIAEKPDAENEKLYDETGEIDIDKEEEFIYNVFIEDIIDNPLTTYSLESQETSNEKETSIQEVETPKIELETSHEESEEIIQEETVLEGITFEEFMPEKTTTEEVTFEESTPSKDINSESQLTIQDDNNLEQAHDLSTYVMIVSPILAQALAPKVEHSRKKVKDVEKIKD